MVIRLISDQRKWTEKFVEFGSPSFLQSWLWGQFQEQQGHPALYLTIENNQRQTIALALTIKHYAKRGRFLFIPHGPIFSPSLSANKRKEALKRLKEYLVSLAKTAGFSFIRIAPIIKETEENKQLFEDLGFRQAPIYLHSERCWLIDNLDKKNSEEILGAMRKTTRYLIRKARKEERLVLEIRTDKKAVDDFWHIYRETFQREHFSPFPKKFISQEFTVFHQQKKAVFIFAKDKQTNQYLATALIIFTASSGFYHQGASLHSKLPASYLVQWGAIMETKKRGGQKYNFWGIYRPGRAPKAWQGLSLFKKGFGGYQIDYLTTQDLIINQKKYWLTYLYEKFLAWGRGVA